MTDGTPSPWKIVPLAAVIKEAQPGFACGERAEAGIIQLRMNNVDTRGRMLWDTYIRVPAESSVIERFCLRPGDVLFNNTNSTELVGKSALFTGHPEPVVFSNHFTRLRVKPEVCSPEFLAAWLLHQWLARTFEHLCNRWIGQSAVKADKLLALPFPLPPLPEQRRIAAKLREQIKTVDRARGAVEYQLSTAGKLLSAFLRSALSPTFTTAWPRRPLAQLATISAPIVDPTLPEYRALPHVNGENIESGAPRLLWLHTAQEDRMTSPKYLFEPGNVLYSKLRPYLRKVFVPDFRGLCSADMYPVAANPDVLRAPFLAWLLLSDDFTTYADAESRRARMPKLNREQLFAWPAPLPPLQEQDRIAAQLFDRLAAVTRLTKGLHAQSVAASSLPQALLRDAFSGRL